MRQFYATCKDFPIVTPLVAQVSWTHNLIIFSRCKEPEEREFYLKLCISENLSKSDLERQINTMVFERTNGNQLLRIKHNHENYKQ
jgi:predicted nuclease of restriction endonuclease-like (RecB) superfamily